MLKQDFHRYPHKTAFTTKQQISNKKKSLLSFALSNRWQNMDIWVMFSREASTDLTWI